MKNNYIMRRSAIMIIISLILFSCKESNTEFETVKNEFEVIIKTDAKIDSISMYPSFVAKSLLDSTYKMLFKGQIKNGSVKFKGNKPAHPVMFDLLVNSIGMSDKFFIDDGTTEVYVSFVNSDKKAILLNDMKSKSQKQYESLKSNDLDSIENLWWNANSVKERRKYGAIRDTLLVNFLKENNNSYVPLWLIANYFSSRSNKYNKLYDESIGHFSDDIKATELYKNLETSLKEAYNFSFQNKNIPLKNTELEAVDFTLNSFNNNKYILLDFWFSNCAPCLTEMPKYIPIYKEYKDRGFEIISISVDKTSEIKKWKQLIKDKEFNWVHYLDENRIETKKLNIYSFPTTFLIDKKGVIIERNITSEKLKSVLSENLD